MEHKIRILNTFRHLFITNENVPFEIPDNEIRVTIHKPLEPMSKLDLFAPGTGMG
jgi:hypothetical protein